MAALERIGRLTLSIRDLDCVWLGITLEHF